ncbi:SRPBCC family protein [Tenacibaculum amylolyticum]|uniref:SRPBCC family protein n=1 Tax=Tenacibaculum amylolyticum TaxID=104269 RepID=UPI00389449BF
MDKCVVKKEISESRKKVWNYLTDFHHMPRWFFSQIPSFEPKIDFKTKFEVTSGERVFTHLWEIVEVEEERCIKYRWQYEEYIDIESFVTFELFDLTANKTELVITFEGIEAYPKNIPEFTLESCRNGWEYFAEELNKYSLENGSSF